MTPCDDGHDAMSDFKIAAAQVASVRGDIEGNIATHAAAIEAAAGRGVSVLVFPELSLTGYERDLAAELAITGSDGRLVPLLALARRHQMQVVVGAPLVNDTAKPHLGAIVLGANGTTRTYCKMHLGTGERPYFTAGNDPVTLTTHGQTIGLAICADSCQPSHPQGYADAGATVYAAGVFLNEEWYDTDSPRLADYAARFVMLVVMANHGASVGTYSSVGKSAVWMPGGALLVQAGGEESCLVIASGGPGAWCGEVVGV
jgi:predicted amidohydrolase